MSYGTGRTSGAGLAGRAHHAPSHSRPAGSSGYTGGSGSVGDRTYGYAGSSSSYTKPAGSGSSGSSQFPSSTQFTYSTGNPYASQLSSLSSQYPGAGPIGAKKFPPGAIGLGSEFRGRGGRGGGRGRGRGRGGRGGAQQQKVIKPQPPVPLTSDQKSKIENHNMKQLVVPKPPHRVLNEMVGGGVKFEYTENPPLPPGMMMEDMPAMHTLITDIDGDTSTGTGPSHEIAKNICAEHAIMGIVSKRYENMNQMARSGVKNKEEMMLEDETPFELASIAIFKMFNEWEASGYELPRSIESVLYATNQFVPVKQRLGWIRGSNLGYTTPLQGVGTGGGRKRPMAMPSTLEQKNPVAFLNEIRGNVVYTLLGSWGTGPNMVFSMGTNIDGKPYSGTGPNKKEAKKNCAKDVLSKLYRINMPNA